MAKKLIFVDFETRSKVDITSHGLHRYAADPTTLPLMLVYGNESGHAQWNVELPFQPKTNPACPDDLRALIEDPEVEFHAHNAAFEIAIYDSICVGRWGWPPIAHDRWHCTAARAAAANQPRSLDKVGQRLKVKALKDNKGKYLIKQLSLPQKAQKTYLKVRKDDLGMSVKDKNGRVIKDVNTLSEQYLEEQGIRTFKGDYPGAKYFFNEDPGLMEEFREYNIQDMYAEIAVHKALPPSHELERPLWLLDHAINTRGIPIDVDLCKGALRVYEQAVNNANARLAIITDGAADKLTQRQRIVDWLNTQVNFGESLTEAVVAAELGKPHPAHVREVLELRKLAGGTAVGKYKAALDYVDEDNRARGQLLYYGATTTGRWSGRGIQPHNFKRAKTLDDTFIEAVTSGDLEAVEIFGDMEGKTVFDVLTGCLRGMICAPEGYKLIRSDFAGIESRVLNWIAGNEKKLQLFRDGQDTYINTALDVYDTTYEAIADWNETKKKWTIKKEHGAKRQMGKVCELGLGYGMGPKTFKTNAEWAVGHEVTDEFTVEVVNKWRAANPEIPEFWSRINDACWHVVGQKNPRVKAEVGLLKVTYDPRDYLCIHLPNGRVLRYFKPTIKADNRPEAIAEAEAFGRRPKRLFYADGGKTGHGANQGLIDTYGGKLTENIVQAISRDLLVNSLFIIDKAGLPIIFHVHDEVVVEIPEDDSEAFGVIHQAMQTVPDWAAGLPLEAETESSRRFSK